MRCKAALVTYYGLLRRRLRPAGIRLPRDMVQLIAMHLWETRTRSAWSATLNAPSTKEGATPMYLAAGAGNSEVVIALLKEAANPDIPSSDSWTPLASASKRGHADVAGLLLQARASTEIPNLNGATALFDAAQEGHLSCVALLVAARANLEAPFRTGATPLYIASANGHNRVVEFLIENRANVNHLEEDGWVS